MSLSYKLIEWAGVIGAIAYSLLLAFNIGFEVLAFSLLFLSSWCFVALAIHKKLYGMLTLQFFYIAAAIIGMLSWQ